MMAHAGKTGREGRGAVGVSRRTSSSRPSSASVSEGVVSAIGRARRTRLAVWEQRYPPSEQRYPMYKHILCVSAHGIVWCGATASGVASRAESPEDGQSSSARTQEAETSVGADQERGADSGRLRQVQDVQGICAKVLATLDYLQRSRREVQRYMVTASSITSLAFTPSLPLPSAHACCHVLERVMVLVCLALCLQVSATIHRKFLFGVRSFSSVLLFWCLQMWQDVEQVKAFVAGMDAQVDTGGWCSWSDVLLREEWRVKQEDLAASTCYTPLTVWLCDLGIVPPPPPSKQKMGGGRRVSRRPDTRMRVHDTATVLKPASSTALRAPSHKATVLRAHANSAPHLHPRAPAAARLAADTLKEMRVVCGGRQDSALRRAPGLWHSLVDSGGLSVMRTDDTQIGTDRVDCLMRTDRVDSARSSFFDGASTARAKWPPPIRSDDMKAHHDMMPRPSSETVT